MTPLCWAVASLLLQLAEIRLPLHSQGAFRATYAVTEPGYEASGQFIVLRTKKIVLRKPLNFGQIDVAHHVSPIVDVSGRFIKCQQLA